MSNNNNNNKRKLEQIRNSNNDGAAAAGSQRPGSSNSNNNGKPKLKPNAFKLFMADKRKELERKGKRFPGGWKQVADLVNQEWLNLAEPVRKKYKEKADAMKGVQVKEEVAGGDEGTPTINHATGNPKCVTEPRVSTAELGTAHQSGNDSGPNDLLRLNSAQFKKVLQLYDQEQVLCQIKSRFLGLVTDCNGLLRNYFPFVHFNYYDRGDSPYTYEPAEVAFANWCIKDGFKVFRGSLIDTRNVTKDEMNHRNTRRSDTLFVPAPRYTYEKGVAYSFGDDDYEKILSTIFDNSVVLADKTTGVKWKYVFTSSRYVDVVKGCLAWLMENSGPVDLNIRVFPMEPVLQELFRCCATIRKLRKRNLRDLKEQDEEVIVLESTTNLLEQKLSKKDYEFVCARASIENVNRSVLGPNYYGMKFWDYRIRLGCTWHQQQANCGGISQCSSMLVRKWSCLALCEAVYLLEVPAGPWIDFLTGKDMAPRPWSEKDAMGLEMRQRVGKDPVTPRRKFELEDKFIFPNLLEKLKATYPKGLPFQPETIIWPVDRDMEIDLNYYPNAGIKIEDPDRILTLLKRKEKVQRDAHFTKKSQETNDDW